MGASIHISVKYLKNAASEHQKLRKKIRKFTLKLAEIKKKNKKKIGSNVENLRNLEPQPEQTFLIKKTKCTFFKGDVMN